MIKENTKLTFQLQDVTGKVLETASNINSLEFSYNRVYVGGDKLVIISEHWPIHMDIKISSKIEKTQLYMDADKFEFKIPMGEDMLAYNPETFQGETHKISIEVTEVDATKTYRNISKNTLCKRYGKNYFPHCSANIETREEPVFFARNTIDGYYESSGHGYWPYHSWGNNRNPNAEIMIEFGRKVCVNQVDIYIRTDFPHDSFWEEATLIFSNGEIMTIHLDKIEGKQSIRFDEKQIFWVKLAQFKKADDDSPFPALTAWDVFGYDL